VPDNLVPLVLLGLATLASVGVVAWSLGILRQPRVLVEGGHWREAAIAAARLGQSWLRIFASVREEAAHAQAACLHLEGKLEESLIASRTLREGALLEGANLVMLGRDPERAVKRLTPAAASPRSSPEDVLFLALAKHAAGDAAGAAETFATVAPVRPKAAPSPRIYEPAFHYLRGLYLLKEGRADEAAKDLALAAESPVSTIYVERARALVTPDRSSSDDGDPRSSLTGQVIGEPPAQT
jgi:hypothetical protein